MFQWQFGQGKEPQWAVRQGDWKLIGNPLDTSESQLTRAGSGRLKEKLFLVNLADDISETTNLAQDHADVVERLKAHRDQLVAELR